MMAVFIEIFGTFGLTISESKTETMCMLIPRASATKIVFNATGQQYHQTTSFTYLGGTVTRPADPRGVDELQALHAGTVRPPEGKSAASEGQMVRSEVEEALFYGCATWTPLEGHYTKLRTAHHRMLLRIL